MNLFILFFAGYFFVYVSDIIVSGKDNYEKVNEEKKKSMEDALNNLTEDEISRLSQLLKDNGSNNNSGINDRTAVNENKDSNKQKGSFKTKTQEDSPKDEENMYKNIKDLELNNKKETTAGISKEGISSNPKDEANVDMQDVLDSLRKKINEEYEKNKLGRNEKGIETGREQAYAKEKGERKSKITEPANADKNNSNIHNLHTLEHNDGKLETENAGNKISDTNLKIEDLLRQLNMHSGSTTSKDSNKNDKSHDTSSNVLEHISNLLQQMQHDKKSDTGVVNDSATKADTGSGHTTTTGDNTATAAATTEKDNKHWMDNIENMLHQFMNLNEQQKKAFQLDKTVNQESVPATESIFLEHDGNKNTFQHDSVNTGINDNLQGHAGTEGWKNRGMNDNNEKLKSYFNALKKNYNPYSYERKILHDLANDDDIKKKYNISDAFEKKIIELFERGDVYIHDDAGDENYGEEGKHGEEEKEKEKRKKEEMFEDINEQDDNDSIEQGSINNRLLRKNQMGQKLLFKNVLNTTENSLYECSCSNKTQNCILYFMDLSNLEYIIHSLEIDVKDLVNKYTKRVFEKQELMKVKINRHSDSFLLPLPPLSKYADVKDVSTYVLRVPKVLFLTTRRSFSSSFDRYFYHLYSVMETQFKWNTFMWGYGFKYYPVMFPKNLNILLQSHVYQLGRQPFDLIFVHESFISSYYNHYFFMKNMPKTTVLVFITDGWDSNIKKKFFNIFPNIMFQNQVNIFEFNPLNNIDIEKEKKKLLNNLWNKMSNTTIRNIIANKHIKKDEYNSLLDNTDKTNSTSNSITSSSSSSSSGNDSSQIEETLWAFLPHGINHCCSIHYDQHFEIVERNKENKLNDELLNGDSNVYKYQNPYAEDEDTAEGVSNKNKNVEEQKKNKREGKEVEEVDDDDDDYDSNKEGRNELLNKNKKFESSYMLLDIFLQECKYKNGFMFNNMSRDIDVLFLYNTATTKQNDFVVQKVMDNIYNKHMGQFKKPIKKYVVDTYFWKIWGLQTTHQLIKNKMQEYNNILNRSKVCVISSKFAGTLNKMVVDALFNGCVVITDKSHNKNLNKYLISTQIPFEYYEITDLIYNKENVETLSKDLIAKIKKTLDEVDSGERNQARVDAYKTILTSYTYTGVILNWIIPTLYFYYNREKYELINNYFVLPHYLENIITKSLKATSAKREKIIANIDISLQEDIIMNNNEVFVWGLIWVFIFSIILCYILRNSSFMYWFFSRRKEVYR